MTLPEIQQRATRRFTRTSWRRPISYNRLTLGGAWQTDEEEQVFRPIAAKRHTTGEPMPKPHLHSAEHEALAQTPRTGLTRVVFIVAGTLCLALAVVATFVPVLPTTPFLLLAAACYMRSSPRLHRWMYTNRLFGEYLTAYRSGRGLPLATKVATLALLWVSIGASAIFGVPASLWWVKLLLLLVAVGVTVHVARLKTLSQT